MKISVIGTGYVGLVTGACLADFGIRRDLRRQGRREDRRAARAARSRSTSRASRTGRRRTCARAGSRSRPTSGRRSRRRRRCSSPSARRRLPDGSTDLTLHPPGGRPRSRENLNGYKVIVTKSTVPVGTGQLISSIVREGTGGKPRVRGGLQPRVPARGLGDRGLHAARPGGDRHRATREAAAHHARHLLAAAQRRRAVRDHRRRERRADQVRLERFLATKISFINEMAELCEALGADVEVVAKGMGLDSRIGNQFLHAGPGFGGSCFPKDTRAVAQHRPRRTAARFRIVEAVLEVNDDPGGAWSSKIEARLRRRSRGATVAVLGLSFKPDTDDMRESPALAIVRRAARRRRRGARLRPRGDGRLPARCCPEVDLLRQTPTRRPQGADALVIVTEWNQFRKLRVRPAARSAAAAADGRPAQPLRPARGGRRRAALRLGRAADRRAAAVGRAEPGRRSARVGGEPGRPAERSRR